MLLINVVRKNYNCNKYSLSLLIDAPVVVVSTDEIDENHVGSLNCTVSSKPESNITLYRATSTLEEITQELVRGNNFLSYRVNLASKNDIGVYRCTADNGLGVIVSTERTLVVPCMCKLD